VNVATATKLVAVPQSRLVAIDSERSHNRDPTFIVGVADDNVAPWDDLLQLGNEFRKGARMSVVFHARSVTRDRLTVNSGSFFLLLASSVPAARLAHFMQYLFLCSRSHYIY
jgi:hypothetical protein